MLYGIVINSCCQRSRKSFGAGAVWRSIQGRCTVQRHAEHVGFYAFHEQRTDIGVASTQERSCGFTSGRLRKRECATDSLSPNDQVPSPGTPARNCRLLLNGESWNAGKYMVYRLYCKECFCPQRMRPTGKRKSSRMRAKKFKSTAPDQTRSINFVFGYLQSGTRFRLQAIVDG